MNRIKKILNSRLGFFTVAIILYWLKTYAAYNLDFELGVSGALQQFILLINPIPIILILLSVALYFKGSKKSYITMLVIYFLFTLLLYSNILYYREFSDFLTTNVILGAGGVSNGGLFSSAFALMRSYDIIYWIDFVFLAGVLVFKRTGITMDKKPMLKRYAFAITSVGFALLAGNLALAEFDRPQLLQRTFDRNYIVKYLGLNFFSGYDVAQTVQNNQVKANADESDLSGAVNFVEENHAKPNDEYFGVAEGKNVVTLVVESTQQFLIDYELEDENGEKHEVTPFLNDLYHDDSTYSFSNFFHQTGQGKSSDAEVLAETSMFGLPQGSAFQTLGSTNTFHATPNILAEEAGYTSAAFHGNVGSFWNRTDTYQQFGYDYFFDSSYYDMSGDRTLEYGLKDKLFFHDSAKYLEQLPQPFYSKFITVANHFPYPLDEANADFPEANTSDETINQYFVTNHYADQAIEEFFTWLKESGLYEDTIVMVYGDHYGVSNARNPVLGEELLGVPQEEWSGYHDAQMQRVPMMFHVPGVDNGEIFDTYGGQVDILPTLLHLLGIETDPYLFMGQDLLSPEHNETVSLRNGRLITPKYTFVNQTIYDTETGEPLNEQLTEDEVTKLQDKRNEANEVLTHSDNILQLDLLRFYTPEPLKGMEPIPYSYSEQMEYLKNDPRRETSLKAQSDMESPAELYDTNAPEMNGGQPVSELPDEESEEGNSEENSEESNGTEESEKAAEEQAE